MKKFNTPLNKNDLIDIMCSVPKFIQTYELIKRHKDLKKGTILVSDSPWEFYTITGWYAHKGDSRLSKPYIFVSEELKVNLRFMDFYQYVGRRVVKEYLHDLKVFKIKTTKQLEKYLDKQSF